jgi:hypothetical protein
MSTPSRALHGRAASTVKEAINRLVGELCARRWGGRLRSCVLTGSMARDEATFIEQQGCSKALGDAEYIAVFESGSPLPSGEEIRLFGQAIDDGLAQEGIYCPTSISPVHPDYLLRMRPHIFGYELRVCGQVVYGDREILSLIPDFGPAEIPLEDGWRLLCNRMVEVLEVACRDNSQPALAYRSGKLCLDMATSYLLFQGAFEPGYRKRAEKLAVLAATLPDSAGPFPSLRGFSQKVMACTELKTGVATSTNFMEILSWQEAVAYARQLWRWESARLFGLSGAATDSDLWHAAFHRQGRREKLRGWAYVMRTSGWIRGARHWPRWMVLGAGASPRYWVYCVASALFFRLPDLLRHSGADAPSDLAALRKNLPVEGETRGSSWRGLAAAIAWNYHQYLELTRA